VNEWCGGYRESNWGVFFEACLMMTTNGALCSWGIDQLSAGN
jgi:hypothetical protein